MPDSDNSLVAKRLRYIERQRALRAAQPEAFAGLQPIGTGPTNRHGMPKLPIGQRQVPNWPVLDLGDAPAVPLDEWRLEVTGLCDNPFTIGWQEFLALPQAEDVSDFHCVTTWSRMDNRWKGVRFRTLAEAAIPAADAAYVLCTGYDHMPGTRIPYTTNLPLARADRRRRPAGAHLGRCAAAAGARRSVPDDHAEALRVERHEMDPQDRVPVGESTGLLGRARLLGHGRAVVRRSVFVDLGLGACWAPMLEAQLR